MRLAILALVGAGVVAVRAPAQTPLFLVPESASVRQGGSVTLRAAAGADAAAWPAERISHFFARTAWTQENRDALAAQEGAEGAAAWPADRPGVLLLGWDLEPRLETVSAESFREFIGRTVDEPRRGAIGAIPEQGGVTIRRVESAKALVRVAGAGAEPASVATSKTGQAVEIRPLMDATALRPGSDLAVRVYARIEGASGGVVIATNTTTGDVVRDVADEGGIANIHLGRAGRWRVEFHAAAPPGGVGADAPWEVHTATLTFDVAEEVNQ